MATDIEKKETGSLPRYRPATDILEREDGFHLFLDMPGVAKEDLVIDLKENELVVGGKADHPPVEGERMIEVEFGGGEYYRAFTLSDAVDQEKIKASLVNGVLEIFMPKKERVLPKRIEIKAG
jgi:HSP20 family molecular chaperone IbpA